MTLIQRSRISMQECRKKQQNGLTYMHYITFQIILCQLSTFPQALQGFHHVLPQSRQAGWDVVSKHPCDGGQCQRCPSPLNLVLLLCLGQKTYVNLDRLITQLRKICGLNKHQEKKSYLAIILVLIRRFFVFYTCCPLQPLLSNIRSLR